MAPFLTIRSVGHTHDTGVCAMVYRHFERGAV